MDDVQGDFLGRPHGTTPAAVKANKITVRSIGSSKTFKARRWVILYNFG